MGRCAKPLPRPSLPLPAALLSCLVSEVKAELAPFSNRVEIDGDNLPLQPKAVQSLAGRGQEV
jgi:hypothetical protein